ncbi:MAG: hypothetical protein IPK82_23820 [Polyangiaceae bacterium]|nr:hypothetical protein [Polyangiaceae bacterium]
MAAIDRDSQRSTRVDRRVHTTGGQAPGVRICSVHTNAATNARVRTTGSIQLAGAALAKGAGVSVVTGGKVDTFAALKKIVAAVPFYGPPAAAALDVARESGVQLVRENKKEPPGKPSRKPDLPQAPAEPERRTVEAHKPAPDPAPTVAETPSPDVSTVEKKKMIFREEKRQTPVGIGVRPCRVGP